jgi:hypothetical protein
MPQNGGNIILQNVGGYNGVIILNATFLKSKLNTSTRKTAIW